MMMAMMSMMMTMMKIMSMMMMMMMMISTHQKMMDSGRHEFLWQERHSSISQLKVHHYAELPPPQVRTEKIYSIINHSQYLLEAVSICSNYRLHLPLQNIISDLVWGSHTMVSDHLEGQLSQRPIPDTHAW